MVTITENKCETVDDMVTITENKCETVVIIKDDTVQEKRKPKG